MEKNNIKVETKIQEIATRWSRYYEGTMPLPVCIKSDKTYKEIDKDFYSVFKEVTENDEKKSKSIISRMELGLHEPIFTEESVLVRYSEHIIDSNSNEIICDAKITDKIEVVRVMVSSRKFITFVLKNDVNIFSVYKPGETIKVGPILKITDSISINTKTKNAVLIVYESVTGPNVVRAGCFMVSKEHLIHIVAPVYGHNSVKFIKGTIVGMNKKNRHSVYSLAGDYIGDYKIIADNIENNMIVHTDMALFFSGIRTVWFSKVIKSYKIVNEINGNSNIVNIIDVAIGKDGEIHYLFDSKGECIGGPYKEVTYYDGLYDYDLDFYHEKHTIVKGITFQNTVEIISVVRCESKVFNHNYCDKVVDLPLETEIKILPGNDKSYLIKTKENDWRIFKANRKLSPEVIVADIN